MNIKFNKKMICGILNITPDSFSDGGKFFYKEKAIKRAFQIIKEKADFIDIGGESSRPFSLPVSKKDEILRVIPVIKEIRKKTNFPISIDTYKPEVAKLAIENGANIINDITGMTNSKMIDIASKYKPIVIVMHMKGNPKTMQENPNYKDIVKEIYSFFKERIKILSKKGIKNIILDPGIGFGKTIEHNLIILKNINTFKKLGYPVLIGLSRKSFIGKLTEENIPKKRDSYSLALNIYSYLKGADILRVHNVKETLNSIKLIEAIKKV